MVPVPRQGQRVDGLPVRQTPTAPVAPGDMPACLVVLAVPVLGLRGEVVEARRNLLLAPAQPVLLLEVLPRRVVVDGLVVVRGVVTLGLLQRQHAVGQV